MDSTTPFQPWTANDGPKIVKIEGEVEGDAKLHRENVNHPKHTQTASHEKETAVASLNAPGSSAGTEPEASVPAKESRMDSEKVASMQQIVENTLSSEERQRVGQLLVAVEGLSGPEKLLLYLRLPTGMPPHDPLKQPVNPLGSRAELQQTITWIQTHLEVDPDVSLPKQDVYDEYIAYCMSSNMKPLSTADFGKVMKQVYPTVRPRRLGTRGNSRYCYAGLRKKIKLEVPQVPDLGESSKEPDVVSRGAERIVCDWAETKLGVKFVSLSDLSRHLQSTCMTSMTTPVGPSSTTPPPVAVLSQSHGSGSDDATSRQLMKQLKRKIQSQSTPGRPKKNKGQETSGESPPSTSYGPAPAVKHEAEHVPEPGYGYTPAYMPVYEVRLPYSSYGAPPRAHPPPHPSPHAAMDYRPDHYAFDPPYATPRDLTVPSDATHNLPINLSSDASLDLSTERAERQRRRPPEPPPARLPLPGKKLILETYQSETRAGSPRAAPTETRPTPRPTEEFPRAEYLPKKMRAAEILGGKLSARQAQPSAEVPPTAAPPVVTSGGDPSARSEVAFLEDPKNATSRSKSTAAALVREEQEAASPTRSARAPTPEPERSKIKRNTVRAELADGTRATPTDTRCGLDCINIKTGVICEEKHSEILNRERVISICNMDKHALDDYLNEGSSQEHEEELLQYFQREPEPDVAANVHCDDVDFLEPGLDPQDDHSQGKNEKLSQLRELLAKNLKNQNGSGSQSAPANRDQPFSAGNIHIQPQSKSVEGAFKPVVGSNMSEAVNGQQHLNQTKTIINNKATNSMVNTKNTDVSFVAHQSGGASMTNADPHLYNGNAQNVPQSPTTRAQQYDFVPISDGCHSPGNFHAKSPPGYGTRGQSPSKARQQPTTGGSLQTSPISHSTAASPFVSPRNTPVPRSRLCPRPIPKHNARRRRTLLSIDGCSKQFAMPNRDQKFIHKASICNTAAKYCQPMSAPPSPNILSSPYKNQMHQNISGIQNGSANLCLNFLPMAQFRDNVNGDHPQPLSADPLSSEVSQFFQESMMNFSPDTSFRSQSVPLKQGLCNMNMLSYNNTPVGSVPPTPVPNEFCDFGSLADTCDISRACLNPESLDKIYDAIDSSNDVLNTNDDLMSVNENLRNGCDQLSSQSLLTEQLTSLIPTDGQLLARSGQFDQTYSQVNPVNENVDEFLKRANSIEFDLSELVTEKNKYYNTSRSVPSTPLPYKRMVTLPPDQRRSRDLFASETYTMSNGISSKSVPSTPQLPEERTMFSYSNRDFLINGNSVEACASAQVHGSVGVDALESPLHEMLREDVMMEPLTPAADLLADLDKMDGTPYVDL